MTGAQLQRLHRPLRAGIEWSIVATGFLLAVWIVAQTGNTTLTVPATTGAIGAIMVWIVVSDIRTFTIPDGASLTMALIAVAERWAAGSIAGDPARQTIVAMCVDVALPGGLLLLFREIHYRRKGFDGLGLGDVKLAAAGGLLVGTIGFSWALFAASLLGLVFVAIHRRLMRRNGGAPVEPSDKLAFGACLAPAIWIVWVLQQMALLPQFARS